MVSIIVGEKGKGKTKYLLDKANAAVKEAHGTIAYLDKSAKHMYELNNKIRLINVSEFPITSADAFVGFIAGILSQDRDLEVLFLDSFLKLASLEGEDITPVIDILEKLSEKYDVDFVLSVSMKEADLPENAKKDILVSL